MSNPNGVEAIHTRGGRTRKGRDRVAVGELCGTLIQGSSCLATMGFGTESPWDSHTAARRRNTHDAVRAPLDRPDFFENLAGNHGE